MRNLFLTSIIMLLSLSACSQNKDNTVGVIPPDGVYCAHKQESSYKDVYIVVKDAKVEGIYKNSINKKNKLKTAKVVFADYDNGNGLHVVNNIDINPLDPRTRCANTNIAVNTKDKNSQYYVFFTACKEECWYDCGEDEDWDWF